MLKQSHTHIHKKRSRWNSVLSFHLYVLCLLPYYVTWEIRYNFEGSDCSCEVLYTLIIIGAKLMEKTINMLYKFCNPGTKLQNRCSCELLQMCEWKNLHFLSKIALKIMKMSNNLWKNNLKKIVNNLLKE